MINNQTPKTKIMLLSFKTKFKNGQETKFVEKIINGLFLNAECWQGNELGFYAELWQIAAAWAIKFSNTDVSQNSNLKSKIHSIREDQKNRWKIGNKIHFYINNRTKDMFQFAPVVPCVSVQTIFFNWGLTRKIVSYVLDIPIKDLKKRLISKEPNIFIDRRLITKKEAEQLAINDGFKDYKDFIKYFNQDFEGKIIHWTNHKY